jgi:hypothetical protein
MFRKRKADGSAKRGSLQRRGVMLTKQGANAVCLLTDSFFVTVHAFITAPSRLKPARISE